MLTDAHVDISPSDPDIIAHGADIVAALSAIVPDGVVADPAGLAAFDGDALTAYRQKPLVTVLPRDADQVAAILSYASEYGVPVVPRGAGHRCPAGRCPGPTASCSR